jgi:hypothetical protein
VVWTKPVWIRIGSLSDCRAGGISSSAYLHRINHYRNKWKNDLLQLKFECVEINRTWLLFKYNPVLFLDKLKKSTRSSAQNSKVKATL